MTNIGARIVSLTVASLLATLAVALLMTASHANASTRQRSVIEEPTRFLSTDPAAQSAALDEARMLGAEIVKAPVLWRELAPPAYAPGLDLPGNYPAGAWDRLDRFVAGAVSRNLKVWLMITAPAPTWAVPRESSPAPGAYRPDVAKLGEFSEAVGRRYPQVAIFSIWNEPNLKRFLQPQPTRGVAKAAVHYRKMYVAAQAGLVKAGHGRSTILFGELLPRGGRANVAPLRWLRDFFCIDKRGRKLRGRAARARGCGRYKRIKTSGFAYHPYALASGPLSREKRADNAPIAYLKRVQKVLDQAYKQRRVSRKRMPIYSSEFGFQSDPPDIYGVPLRKIPNFLNVSEYLSYVDRRVATYSQYLINDDADLQYFQTGLRYVDGTPKPGVYDAYRLPFAAFKRTGSSVVVWGAARAASNTARRVEIQVRQGASWATVATVYVRPSLGYFRRTIRVRNATSKRYRAVWNGVVSRVTKPGRKIRPRR